MRLPEGKRVNSECQSNVSIADLDHQLNGRVTLAVNMRDHKILAHHTLQPCKPLVEDEVLRRCIRYRLDQAPFLLQVPPLPKTPDRQEDQRIQKSLSKHGLLGTSMDS